MTSLGSEPGPEVGKLLVLTALIFSSLKTEQDVKQEVPLLKLEVIPHCLPNLMPKYKGPMEGTNKTTTNQ